MNEPLRVLLVSDSIPYHGPDSRLSLDDPRMFQNVMAQQVEAEIEREVEISYVARAGMTTRDAFQHITKDPALQEKVLPGTDVVIYAAGGSDGLPVGIPTLVKDMIPNIPNDRIRKIARESYFKYHRHFVRLTGARFQMIPRHASLDYWSRAIDLLRFHSGGAPVVALTIQPSNGPHFGFCDPHSKSLNEDIVALAVEKDVPHVNLWPICEPNMDSFNPDGMHWDFETHARVGTELAVLVSKASQQEKHSPWLAD